MSKKPTKRETIDALTKDIADLRTRVIKLEGDRETYFVIAEKLVGERERLLAIEQRIFVLEHPVFSTANGKSDPVAAGA